MNRTCALGLGNRLPYGLWITNPIGAWSAQSAVSTSWLRTRVIRPPGHQPGVRAAAGKDLLCATGCVVAVSPRARMTLIGSQIADRLRRSCESGACSLRPTNSGSAVWPRLGSPLGGPTGQRRLAGCPSAIDGQHHAGPSTPATLSICVRAVSWPQARKPASGAAVPASSASSRRVVLAREARSLGAPADAELREQRVHVVLHRR